MRSLLFLLPVCLVAAEDDAAFFEKNVRPLIAAKCQVCHGNAQNAMAGLALDSREHVLKGGGRGAAVVPGQPAASLLMRVVTAADGVPKMPPSPQCGFSPATAMRGLAKPSPLK